jgi:hypothetical protein
MRRGRTFNASGGVVDDEVMSGAAAAEAATTTTKTKTTTAKAAVSAASPGSVAAAAASVAAASVAAAAERHARGEIDVPWNHLRARAPRLLLYSAHDSTLLALLSAVTRSAVDGGAADVGADLKTRLPPFASSFVLELHERTDGDGAAIADGDADAADGVGVGVSVAVSEAEADVRAASGGVTVAYGDYYVRALFNSSPLQLLGCALACPLDEFNRRVAAAVPRGAAWRKECGNDASAAATERLDELGFVYGNLAPGDCGGDSSGDVDAGGNGDADCGGSGMLERAFNAATTLPDGESSTAAHLLRAYFQLSGLIVLVWMLAFFVECMRGKSGGDGDGDKRSGADCIGVGVGGVGVGDGKTVSRRSKARREGRTNANAQLSSSPATATTAAVPATTASAVGDDDWPSADDMRPMNIGGIDVGASFRRNPFAFLGRTANDEHKSR